MIIKSRARVDIVGVVYPYIASTNNLKRDIEKQDERHRQASLEVDKLVYPAEFKRFRDVDAQYWLLTKESEHLISNITKLVVLEFKGWITGNWVNDVINKAESLDIPVEFVEVN